MEIVLLLIVILRLDFLKISNEMLRDIDKNTVLFSPNFDDTTEEPTVLPARFPALLVYGAQGISAGYATNIPPHNLGEDNRCDNS